METSQLLFSCLPEDIKSAIYKFAGLIRPCPVVLINGPPPSRPQQYPTIEGMTPIFECVYPMRQKGAGQSIGPGDPECVCVEFPKQLLLVSKSVYQEVHPILYGQNKFVIRAHQPSDLSIINRLSPASISALRQFMVRLNSWPCLRGHSRANLDHNICLDCHSAVSSSDKTFQPGDVQSYKIIKEWRSVSRVITNNVTAGQLRFTFISDVEYLEIADKLIHPLRRMPRLRECNIRLGRRPDYDLQSLATSTSKYLTGGPEDACGPLQFPFERLPKELRLQSLNYTHLGSQGGYDAAYTVLRIENNRLVQRKRGPSTVVKRECCLDCTFTKTDCCCALLYAAYSASCRCKILPMELFFTSRQMHTEAMETLYSANCFQFRQPFASSLEFFEQLHPTALKMFRQINFTFCVGETRNWVGNKDAWSNLLTFIRDNLNVRNLLISIDISCDWEDCIWADDEEYISRPIYRSYLDMAQRIKDLLPHLLDLHITLGWFFDLEPILEKYIMGNTYRSEIGNKHAKPQRDIVGYLHLGNRGVGLPSWHCDEMFRQ